MPANIDNLGISGAAMAAVFDRAALPNLTPNTSTAYTIKPSDNGKYLRFTAAGAVIATVAQDSSGAIANGGEIVVEAGGAGGTTITAGSGVTFHGASGVLAQYAVRRVRKVAANTYTLY